MRPESARNAAYESQHNEAANTDHRQSEGRPPKSTLF
jgi:hypothetical protein